MIGTRLLPPVARSALLPLAGLVGASLALPAAAAEPPPVTHERLVDAANEPQNWLMPHGNYELTRYSKLNQINRTNVASLKLAFAYALGGMRGTGASGPQNGGPPLVADGFLYVADGWGSVYKLDVSSGRKGVKVWTVDANVEREGNAPRTGGVAMFGELVFEHMADGRVVAIDRATGEFVWDRQVGVVTDFGAKEKFSAAPLAFDGRLIVANGAGDSGTRGWLAALDARTGQEQWRFWTVPAPGEAGHETWKDDNNAWKTGGADLWGTGAVDVAHNVTIWGTGNPNPPFDAAFRPGDNLYSDSMIALSTSTGRLKWYFQYTPNKSWSYEEQGTHFLYDLDVDGAPRPMVGHFGRNGFFYRFDRLTGAFIAGTQYVNELTWTAGLDPRSGRPLEYDPTLDVQRYRLAEPAAVRPDSVERSCPSGYSGVGNTQAQAYNPVKHLACGAGAEGCSAAHGGGEDAAAMGSGVVRKRVYASDQYHGAVTAIDVATGKVIAKAIFDFENQSGVLATAGDLVFTGLPDGAVVALDDRTLRELWRIELGTPVKCPPMTFAVGGKQFVAIVTSGRDAHPVKYDQLELSSYLFVFAL